MCKKVLLLSRFCGNHIDVTAFGNYSTGNDALIMFQSFQDVHKLGLEDDSEFTVGFNLNYEVGKEKIKQNKTFVFYFHFLHLYPKF